MTNFVGRLMCVREVFKNKIKIIVHVNSTVQYIQYKYTV